MIASLANGDVSRPPWPRAEAQPRKRVADLAIAATAIVHGAVLLTENLKDLAIIADLVEAQAP